MFISHNHNDHILGSIWVIRAVCNNILNGKYEGNLNIYCHQSSIDAIKSISFYVLQNKFTKFFDNRVLFIPINNGDEAEILGRKTIFFDINLFSILFKKTNVTTIIIAPNILI